MDGGIWRSRRRRLLPHGKYGPDRVPLCHRNRIWTHARPHMTSEENQGKISFDGYRKYVQAAIWITVGKIFGGHTNIKMCSKDPPELTYRFIFFTNFFPENIFSPEDGPFWPSAIFDLRCRF